MISASGEGISATVLSGDHPATTAALAGDLGLDVAALSLIVEEAGGRFTNLEGKPVTLGITSVLATNRALHSPILEALG